MAEEGEMKGSRTEEVGMLGPAGREGCGLHPGAISSPEMLRERGPGRAAEEVRGGQRSLAESAVGFCLAGQSM